MHARAFLAIILSVASVSATVPAYNLTQAMRVATVTTANCINSGQVALTFDDGPHQLETAVRNSLGESKGTFFVSGRLHGCIYDYADQLKAAYAAGWTIANHGWSHAHMVSLSEAQMDAEIAQVETALIKILGIKPKYFRPPYGESSSALLAVLGNRGYTRSITWSDYIGDASGKSVTFSENIYNTIKSSYPAPHLVLNHGTVETTSGQVLPYAIPLLEDVGYTLVTVDHCLGDSSPYQSIGRPQVRDSTWHC